MKRILIVDDRKNLLFLYKSELESYGFQVDTAETPPAAIRLCRRLDYDLAIIEVDLRGAGGVELYERLRGPEFNLPVIINSTGDGYLDWGLKYASEWFVMKSSDLCQLIEKVRSLLLEPNYQLA